MNNQEAAEMIRDDMKLHHDYLSGKYRKALNMAISALEAQETKTCDTCIHNNKTWDDDPCDDPGNYCPKCGADMREEQHD